MSELPIQSDMRAVAIEALLHLFAPLTQFAIDAGLTPGDLNSILRFASVKGLADKQRAYARRVNISGISAVTGIPRLEVSRILRSDCVQPIVLRQSAMYRVLTEWHKKSRFSDGRGSPRELEIYGKGSTFESLVRTHGRGIPLRAILDELIRTGAVELVAPQKVRAVSPSNTSGGINAQLIKAFRDRTGELISIGLASTGEQAGAENASAISGPKTKRKNLRRKDYIPRRR